MTGRKGRVVSNDDGSITYESRSELDVPVEILNLTEKQRFMDGEKVKMNLKMGINMRFGVQTIKSGLWGYCLMMLHLNRSGPHFHAVLFVIILYWIHSTQYNS